MKVLLAVDGSEYSAVAAQMLSLLPWKPEDNIVIFMALPSHGPLLGILPQPLMSAPSVLERLARSEEEAAHDILESIRKSLEGCGAKLESIHTRGAPAEEIINAADRFGADLVVVGSKGMGGIQHFVLGSVSQRVLSHSRPSVLVVKPPAQPVRQVVVGYDGSAPARAALDFLAQFPLHPDAEVCIVHVVEPYHYHFGGAPLGYRHELREAMEEIWAAQRQEGEKVAKAIEAEYKGRFPHVTSQMRFGHPSQELLDAIRERNANLVVVGHKGHHAVEHFLMGSVAQKVTRYAGCAVLVVKGVSASR